MTLEQGTGIVHSSPAYGIEDFQSCRSYGMKDDDMLNPVQGDGRYAESLPLFGGLKIWDANPKIVEKLARGRRAAVDAEKFTHSYMHCWRHKTPMIYRATTQWFAGMDDVPGFNGAKPAQSLRQTALAGIEATQFYPAWGKARLYGMIANRPDWTLSRQRQWGVPMPFFVHKETGALHPRTLELLETVAERVEQGGIEAWQAHDRRGADRRRRRRITTKIRDTLDVWFDSGSTHQTVLGGPDGRAHRGGLAPAADRLPGRPVPRRLGPAPRLVPFVAAGVVHAQRRAAVQGAADARLRRRRRRQEDVEVEGQRRRAAEGHRDAGRRDAAAVGGGDRLSGELSISDEILKRVVESYRRIRNTLRFLLANTADFDPAKHAVPVADLLEIDRYALDRRAALADGVRRRLRPLRVPPGRAEAATFCSEDLGRLLPRRAQGPAVHDRGRTAARAARRRPRWRRSATRC